MGKLWQFFIEGATNLLMSYATKRGRIFKITGTAGPEDVYLIRYYIVKSRYFNFFVHQFLRSDRDDLHDHPWNFCTYLVKGSYTENKWIDMSGIGTVNGKNGFILPTRRTVKENRFVFRKATDQHQVVVDRDLKESEKDQAATTLFFSGPTKREWGFIKQIGDDRVWFKWTTYLGLPENTKSRG